VFEFHGWVTVYVDDRDDPEMDVMRVRRRFLVALCPNRGAAMGVAFAAGGLA